MDWIGTLGLVIAALTAVGTIWYNWRRSRVQVRQQQFAELTETVRVLGEELRTTRAELRTTKAELKAAESRIDELYAENTVLKGRVAELEGENRALRAKLQRAGTV